MVFQGNVRQLSISGDSYTPALQAASGILSQQEAARRQKEQNRFNLLAGLLTSGTSGLVNVLGEKAKRNAEIKELLRKEELKNFNLEKDVEAHRAAGIDVPVVPGTFEGLTSLLGQASPGKKIEAIKELAPFVGESSFPYLTSSAEDIAKKMFGQGLSSSESSVSPSLVSEYLTPQTSTGKLVGGISEAIQGPQEIGFGFQKLKTEEGKRKASLGIEEVKERVARATEKAQVQQPFLNLDKTRSEIAKNYKTAKDGGTEDIKYLLGDEKGNVYDRSGFAFEGIKMTPKIAGQRKLFNSLTNSQKGARINKLQSDTENIITITRAIKRMSDIIEENPNAWDRIVRMKTAGITNDPVGAELADLDSQLRRLAMQTTKREAGGNPSDIEQKSILQDFPSPGMAPERFAAKSKTFMDALIRPMLNEAITVGSAPAHAEIQRQYQDFLSRGRGATKKTGLTSTQQAELDFLLGGRSD